MSGVENHVTPSTQSASRPSPKTKPTRVAQPRRNMESEKRHASKLIKNVENSGMRSHALPGDPVVTPIAPSIMSKLFRKIGTCPYRPPVELSSLLVRPLP